MADWKRSDLSAILEPLKGPLELIKAAAEAGQVILEPLIEALQLALAFIQAIDPSDFDIEFLLALLVDVDVVHLYPSQPYQAQRFTPWLDTMLFSFGAGQDDIPIVICSQPPFSFFLFAIEADSLGLLFDLSKALRAFFGYTGTLFDDTPLRLNRPLIQIEQSTCMHTTDLFPWLGDVAEFLSANVKINGSHYVRALQEAIVLKLETLLFLIDDINKILEALEALQIPEIWLYQDHGLDNLSEVRASVLAAGSGPSQNSYVAGTGVLTGIIGGAVLGPIVGIA